MKGIYIGLTYSLILGFLLYFIAIPAIADATETKNMLFLAATILIIIVYSIFLILKRVFGVSITNRSLLNELLLWLLSELVLAVLSGELSLFGILYKFGFFKHLDADVVQFRINRDFAFSASFFLSAIITIGVRLILLKRNNGIKA